MRWRSRSRNSLSLGRAGKDVFTVREAGSFSRREKGPPVPALRFASMVAGLLLTASACSEMTGYSRGVVQTPEQRERELELLREEAESRRQWEIEQEPLRWPPEVRSRCDAHASVNTPEVCIRLTGPRSIGKGSGVTYRIEWRNLPRGALIVSLERDAPPGERWRYLGELGPLQLSPARLSGNGARDFSWNGRQVGCAPADVPTWCDGVEIGSYRLHARVVDLSDHRSVRWPEGRQARVLAWSRSEPLTISGAVDMRTVLRDNRSETLAYLERRVGFFTPFYDAFIGRAPRPTRPHGPGHCAQIPLEQPLRGTLEACIKDEFIEPAGVTAGPQDVLFGGDIDYLPGLIRQDRAADIARQVAMRGYERSADYIGWPGLDEARRGGGGDERNNPRTWLETYMRDRAYRRENGGYWLFVVDQMVHNFRGSGRAGAYDRLLVKVEPGGAACLVGRGTMEDYNPAIERGELPGGMTREQALPFYDPERWARPCPRG